MALKTKVTETAYSADVSASITREIEIDEAESIRRLVAAAVRLNAKIKADEAKLARYKEELVLLAPGKYFSDDDDRVTVVGASTAIKPSEAQVAAAHKLAKEKAGLIFKEVRSYKCVDGFREIVRAVFTPARAEKIIALCEVPTAAQVRF